MEVSVCVTYVFKACWSRNLSPSWTTVVSVADVSIVIFCSVSKLKSKFRFLIASIKYISLANTLVKDGSFVCSIKSSREVPSSPTCWILNCISSVIEAYNSLKVVGNSCNSFFTCLIWSTVLFIWLFNSLPFCKSCFIVCRIPLIPFCCILISSVKK